MRNVLVRQIVLVALQAIREACHVSDAGEIECRESPGRGVRYWTRGATRPRSSSTSRVEGWNIDARDSRLGAGVPSNTVTGTPARTSAAAAKARLGRPRR